MSDSVHHFYVSTACQHTLHSQCRRECKWCTAFCLCPCHSEQAKAVNEPLPTSEGGV